MNQYYGIGAILAVGVIGGLGYYIYQTKKEEVPNSPASACTPLHSPQNPPPQQPHFQTNKFEMD